MRRLSAVVLLVLSCLPSVAVAAAGPPAQVQTERERRVARALAIVDDALASVSSLRLPQNRVRLRLSVCDALWTYDRERAKRVANDAIGDLIALASDPDGSGWREGRTPRMIAASLRQQLIYDLMQRDPEFALDALQRTRGVAQASVQAGYDPDREIEVQIASMLTSSSSARAIDVAEKSLARGLSYNLASVLQQVRSTDPEGAARLAGEIFDKLKGAKPLTDDAATGIAMYLISDALQTDESRQGAKPLLGATEARALEDQYFGALLTFRAGDATGDDLNRAINLSNNLNNLLELLAQRSPSAADALKKKGEELQTAYARLYGGGQVQPQSQPPADATADQLVEAAASVPEDMHDNYIYAAAEKARASGDVDRARSIITSNVQDPSLRRQYADNLDRMAFYDAVSSGRVDDARALLRTFDQPAERIQALLQIAAAAGLPQHTPQSLSLLAEADALAGDRASDSEVFAAKLSIAQAYAEVDPARSFAILDTCVDQLDTLLDAAAAMEGFGCDRQYQDGELVMFDGGGRLTGLLTQITQTLGVIAHKDVDRAAQTAGAFRRPESRSLALLAVAKIMLETPPPADAPAPATEASVEQE